MDESKISAIHFLLLVLHFYTITLTTIKGLFNKKNSYIMCLWTVLFTPWPY